MKNMRRVALCILLLGCLLLTAAATEVRYADIAELYQEVWGMGEMPDWVCSVCSTDGSVENMTVIVKSQEAAEELAAMLEDTATLTVLVSENGYTDAELQQVQEEIVRDYMSVEDSQVYGCGIGWTTINGETTGFGESGLEARVVVDVDAARLEEYTALFAEKYGDRVYVEGSDGIVLTEETASVDEERPWWILGAAAVLVVAAGILLALWKKRKR